MIDRVHQTRCLFGTMIPSSYINSALFSGRPTKQGVPLYWRSLHFSIRKEQIEIFSTLWLRNSEIIKFQICSNLQALKTQNRPMAQIQVDSIFQKAKTKA